MTNETQQASGTENCHIPFGAKLQSARESMNMDRKDVAAQLRLHEKYIDMMENDNFPNDMPAIFARGYIRAYGKLLQISEDTIAEGLAPIQAAVTITAPEKRLKIPVKKPDQATSRKYVMRSMTAVIVITMLWMIGAWWHNRVTTPAITEDVTTPSASTQPTATMATTLPGITMPPAIQIPLRPADSDTAITKPELPKLNQAKLPSPVSIHASNTQKALPSPVRNTTTNNQTTSADDEDDYYYVD